MPQDQRPIVAPIEDRVDHVRGPAESPVILEYGDYECPYSRQAFHEIERVERELPGRVRFAFRHFPLTAIHPHALPAACAAEAAALQGRFWEMHELLFHRQKALADDNLRAYGEQLGLDFGQFESDRFGRKVLSRIARDTVSGEVSGVVRGTPTLFVDGVLYEGAHDSPALLQAGSR